MTTIVVIPGSWRRESFNGALARAAVAAMPSGVSATLESIRDFPLLDLDLEAAHGVPAPVARLKDVVAAADGVLLVTPEHNNSMPGAFKNAIDWMSRPPKDSARVYKGRAFGLIGATDGKGGTRLSQAAWLPVLRTLGVTLYTGGAVYASEISRSLGPDGEVNDPKLKDLVARYVQGFAAFARRNAARPSA